MISGVQIRAGRALLGWDQAKLGQVAGVSIITIKRLEAAGEDIHAHFTTVMKVKAAFDDAGVIFLGEESGLGYGVRLRRSTRAHGRKQKGRA